MFCGMDIYKVMCSVQSSLLFLYYVVFSVMSVGFSVHSVQCQSIGRRRSMQVVFSISSVS